MTMEKLKPKHEILETLAVFGFLLGILFPIRILFVTYITDTWFGSLGILTAVYVIIIILVLKNKMGKFGKMIARQLFKIHRGKRKYFVYTNIAIATIFFGMAVYGMESAKSDYYQGEIDKLLEELPQQHLKGPIETQEYVATELPKMSPDNIMEAILTLLVLPITNHEQYIILWGITDRLTEGWFLNLSIVLFTEELEVIGMLIGIRLIIKEKFLNQ